MNKTEFIDALASSNRWEKDRFGHYKCITKNTDGENVKFRLKIQKISVRLERCMIMDDGAKKWFNISSAYYKDIINIRERAYRLGGAHISL